MQIHKITFKATGIISIISLIISIKRHAVHDYAYDLSLTIFGSALVSMVISIMAFSHEADKVVSAFLHTAFCAYKIMDKVIPLRFEDDEEKALLIDALKGNKDSEMQLVNSHSIQGVINNYDIQGYIRNGAYTDLEFPCTVERYRTQIRDNIKLYQDFLKIDFPESNRPERTMVFHTRKRFKQKAETFWNEAIKEQTICKEYMPKLLLYIEGKIELSECIDDEMELEGKLFPEEMNKSNHIYNLFNELWAIYDGDPLPGR